MGFTGAWVAGETWTFEMSSTTGLFTIGLGQLGGLVPSCCLTLGDRTYIGQGIRFNLSSNGDPTLWEEQNSGASFIDYRSQYGAQDTIGALTSLQGRLAVLAARTIQIWGVNADPSQFSLVQVLDNIGTGAPLSVQQLGDYDVLFLDYTGIRSLRSRELTLNAFINDIGSSIDVLIQAAIVGYDVSQSCGITDPQTKRYWCYINGSIYVLSYYVGLKIVAWSRYLPTYDLWGAEIIATTGPDTSIITVVQGSYYHWTKRSAISLTNGTQTLIADGYFQAVAGSVTVTHPHSPTGPYDDGAVQLVTPTTFTPVKFVINNGTVYCLASNGKVYQYGGSNNTVYDTSQCTGEIPWLDGKRPELNKIGLRLDVAMDGMWQVEVGLDPRGSTATKVVVPFQASVQQGPVDSTFDNGQYSLGGMQGTHFKAKFYTSLLSGAAASFSAITYQYNEGKKQ
jgi:hypothetical protein